MSDQMMIRIEADLKAKLARLARAEGKTTSQMVRELVRSYIKERDIAAYIDGLWDRIGAKIAMKGARLADVRKAVAKARKGRE